MALVASPVDAAPPRETIEACKIDSSYQGSPNAYQSRENEAKLHAFSTAGTVCLPAGFPPSINTTRVWSHDDLEDAAKYLVFLSETDILEIKDALHYFKGKSNLFKPRSVESLML